MSRKDNQSQDTASQDKTRRGARRQRSQQRQWSRLENAAKIFPSVSNLRDTKVFRFSCELYQPVEPELLQYALDRTLKQFPLYRSVLKQGLFWYYFEASDLPAVVKPDEKPLCSPLYSNNRKNLLFEVTYYKNRINLEVYHALSDGTGALHFLRTMVFYYLAKKYDIPRGSDAIDYDASQAQKRGDSFAKYYTGQKTPPAPKAPKAHRLRGERFSEYRLGAVEGVCSVARLLEVARGYGATITEYLAAVLMLSIRQGMTLREEQRPVVLSIPVNLRKYFPSRSARNFFGVTNIGYTFAGEEVTLEALIAHVRETLREETKPEQLRLRMERLSALEHNYAAKVIPLPLKNIVLRFFNSLNAQQITASFSNVGVVQMPPEVASHIRLFDVMSSTQRLQVCFCSYGDNFVTTFTSTFVNTDIQQVFFRTLTAQGIAVEIASNLGDLLEDSRPDQGQSNTPETQERQVPDAQM